MPKYCFHNVLCCSCEYDYVAVRDGGTSHSALLAQVCGASAPDTQRSTGHVMYVRFRTDTSVQHVGFRAKFSIGKSTRN